MFIANAVEKIIRLADGDMREVMAWADPEEIYSGESRADAAAAMEEFAAAHPCGFEEQGLGGAIVYHVIALSRYDEESDEDEEIETRSTLTDAALDAMRRHAGGIDRTCEDEGF